MSLKLLESKGFLTRNKPEDDRIQHANQTLASILHSLHGQAWGFSPDVAETKHNKADPMNPEQGL